MYNDIDGQNGYKWLAYLKDLLSKIGFGEAWAYQSVGNEKLFLEMCKQRISDIYKQDWFASLNDSSKARTYILFKESFSPSCYLNLCNKYSIALTRFFTRNHYLNVETGSWHKPQKIPYHLRFCGNCSNELEDEYHFVMMCPMYEDLRAVYIKPFYRNRPSMFKFINLCKTTNKKDLVNLAKYIILASDRKKRLITVLPP